MTAIGLVKKGAYYDSVTLMGVSRKLLELDDVSDASIVMGTEANLSILKAAGLLLPEFKQAGDTDLLIAIKTSGKASALKAAAQAETLLKDTARQDDDGQTDAFRAGSFEAAAEKLPTANLALISVAGRYAAIEAQKALDAGLHVMLFSDNVALADEIALKKAGKAKGLLVMGPDSGTAIINGVPLAFANVVRRGPVGVVAASGTGAQEVSCLLSNMGVGISQLIGVGGRDVKAEVGGIMFIEGLKALQADKATKVILLVSKPPAQSVQKTIMRQAAQSKKPVITLFLGDEPKPGVPQSLEDAAVAAAQPLLDRATAASLHVERAEKESSLEMKAEALAHSLQVSRRRIRGLFSGGTFCAEAQVVLGPTLGTVYSNAPAGASARKLSNALKSRGHSFIDLGEDEFTQGRPHPMIDLSLRNERILSEARDPDTAVILLDVVLGYGSHPDPASELVPVIKKAAAQCLVICSVTGTDQDPQQRSRTITQLQKAGALIADSNASACRIAGWIANLAKRRQLKRAKPKK